MDIGTEIGIHVGRASHDFRERLRVMDGGGRALLTIGADGAITIADDLTPEESRMVIAELARAYVDATSGRG